MRTLGFSFGLLGFTKESRLSKPARCKSYTKEKINELFRAKFWRTFTATDKVSML